MTSPSFRRRFISRSTTPRCTARAAPGRTPSAGGTRHPATSSEWADRWADTMKRPLRSDPLPPFCPRVYRPRPLRPPRPRTRSATWRTWTGCSGWRRRTSTSTVVSYFRWRSPASSWCTGSSTGTWATTSSTTSSTWTRNEQSRRSWPFPGIELCPEFRKLPEPIDFRSFVCFSLKAKVLEFKKKNLGGWTFLFLRENLSVNFRTGPRTRDLHFQNFCKAWTNFSKQASRPQNQRMTPSLFFIRYEREAEEEFPWNQSKTWIKQNWWRADWLMTSQSVASWLHGRLTVAQIFFKCCNFDTESLFSNARNPSDDITLINYEWNSTEGTLLVPW